MKKMMIMCLLASPAIGSKANAERLLFNEETVPYVVSPQPPPQDQLEATTTRPGPDYTWIRGHWNWDGKWVWTRGHWSKLPHPQAEWVLGHWDHRPHGWVWTHGRWR